MNALRLVVVEGHDVGREFEIAGVITLGRDHSVGIVVDDEEVSRRHASLSPEGDGVAVEDLGSTNGTFVNGEPISQRRVLSVGEKLRLGNTVMELLPAAADTKRTPAPPATETRLHVPKDSKEEAGD